MIWGGLCALVTGSVVFIATVLFDSQNYTKMLLLFFPLSPAKFSTGMKLLHVDP